MHWASSDKDACEIVYEIMREKNITKLLKGKSMASEEIGLNHYLEKRFKSHRNRSWRAYFTTQ